MNDPRPRPRSSVELLPRPTRVGDSARVGDGGARRIVMSTSQAATGVWACKPCLWSGSHSSCMAPTQTLLWLSRASGRRSSDANGSRWRRTRATSAASHGPTVSPPREHSTGSTHLSPGSLWIRVRAPVSQAGARQKCAAAAGHGLRREAWMAGHAVARVARGDVAVSDPWTPHRVENREITVCSFVGPMS